MSKKLEEVLWNEEHFDSRITFEQYKLYVEMADNISSRREGLNKFFLTLHTSILGAVICLVVKKLIIEPKLFLIIFYFWAIMASVYWHRLIKSYRSLNTAKFKIIGLVESKLPLNLYGKAEWEHELKGGKTAKYEPLTHIEELIPIGVGIIYLLVGGYQILSL